MSAEGFFKRWSRLKTDGGAAADPVQPPPPVAAPLPGPAVPAPGRAAPTLADAARLTPEADFSAFVAQGVDKTVQRLALKKLFADPHFKVLDGLDMYMDDYNKPSPVSAAMLAALDHARGALRLPERPAAEAPGADTPGADTPGQPEALADVAPAIVTQDSGAGAYTEAEDTAAIAAGPAPSSPQGPA